MLKPCGSRIILAAAAELIHYTGAKKIAEVGVLSKYTTADISVEDKLCSLLPVKKFTCTGESSYAKKKKDFGVSSELVPCLDGARQ